MKKIIISEKAEQLLYNMILKEEKTYLGDKENIVRQWLNDHFKPMENETYDDMGLPKIEKIVSILDTKKQITQKLITLERVFFMLQTQFKKILNDKKDRDEFLWETLNKWYND
jgi:hypothetical protein